MPNVRVKRFVLGPFETNCYIVWIDDEYDAKPAWFIDAGFNPADMVAFAERERLAPQHLLLTHAHADHIAGLDHIRNAFPAMKVALHPAEAHWLADPELNLSAGFGQPMRFEPADEPLNEGDTRTLGRPDGPGVEFNILHTPGHSPGGVVLYSAELGAAFAGDTLFHGSIGRTDFPTSDHQALLDAIRTKLYTLPDETVVLPGHMGQTTIGDEKHTNPFVRAH